VNEHEELLAFFQEQYRRARGSLRDVRAGDRLYEDLAIDSLLANELLIALEDRHGVQLLHDPRVWGAVTVEELLELVCDLRARQQVVANPATADRAGSRGPDVAS
jgi:acyl carrier protein